MIDYRCSAKARYMEQSNVEELLCAVILRKSKIRYRASPRTHKRLVPFRPLTDEGYPRIRKIGGKNEPVPIEEQQAYDVVTKGAIF